MKVSAKTLSAKKPKPRKQASSESIARKAGKIKRPSEASPVVESKVPPAPAKGSERVKLVRDSFTMPRDDFDLIAQLKTRALEFKRPTKKSELLRAGLQQLASMDEGKLRAALAALRPLKVGRPKKVR